MVIAAIAVLVIALLAWTLGLVMSGDGGDDNNNTDAF